ncbi:NAD-dependent epimerase/dehydratase family protein [Kibdelosporangium lantanae]
MLRRDEKVVAVNRGGRADLPVEVIAADAADPDRMREVCAGATAVYNCVNPPIPTWLDVFPRVNRALVTAAAATGAVLVFADDTWMYGRVDGPMTEDTPARPVTHLGLLRAWLADLVLRPGIQAVIGRAGELYGPGVRSLLGDNIFRGGRPVYFGNPDLPITPTYIEDFARALATLGSTPTSWGQVWHVPTGPVTTGRDLVRLATGSNRLWKVSQRMTWPLRLQSATVRLGADMIYQFEQPFVVDSSKFDTEFGTTATSYEDGVRATLAWYREDPRRSKRPLVAG